MTFKTEAMPRMIEPEAEETRFAHHGFTVIRQRMLHGPRGSGEGHQITARERRRSRNGTVDVRLFHQGADDAEVLQGGFGRAHGITLRAKVKGASETL
jgi:hypothetical protein